MRILVTGMSGLVGGLVGRGLAREHEVRALGRREVPGAETTLADITNLAAIRSAFQDVEVVVHCAGYQGDDWNQAITANVLGTRNVLEAARECGVRRVIFTSSGSVQQGYEQREPIRSLLQDPSSWIPHLSLIHI